MLLTLQQAKSRGYNQPPVEIMAGEDLTINYILDSEIEAAITGVFFVCKALNTRIALTNTSDNYWLLSIGAAETADWAPNMYEYDLEVFFENDYKETVLYNSPLLVLRRGE